MAKREGGGCSTRGMSAQLNCFHECPLQYVQIITVSLRYCANRPQWPVLTRRFTYRMRNSSEDPIRVAVVAGGAGGLGKAFTARFAESGYLVLSAVRGARWDRGENVRVCELDLAKRESVDSFIDVAASLPWIDILVLNAATLGIDKDPHNVLQINAIAHALIAERLRPLLERSPRHPRVVAVSSGDGELLYFSAQLRQRLELAARAPTFSAWVATVQRIFDDAFRDSAQLCVHGGQKSYKLSKAALNSYVRASGHWRRGELACAVSVFAVCPGDVDTAMLDESPTGCVVSPSTAISRMWRLLDVRSEALSFRAAFWRDAVRIPW